jgi:hypothetical protein
VPTLARDATNPARVTTPATTRSVAAVAGGLAWFMLQSFGVGCAQRPSTVTALAPPDLPARDAFSAAITCDPGNHAVLLSWIAGDSSGYRLWFSRSSDQGATWSVPVRVSPEGEPLRLEPESPPRMVCDDEHRVGIAWASWSRSTGALASGFSDVRFARSSDDGRSWSEPTTVNDDGIGGPGSQAFQDVALRPEGGLFAAWLDSRPGADHLESSDADSADAAVWFARSEDFGAHWGPNLAQWSRACPNSRVSLVVAAGGEVFASFRKQYSGQVRDVVLARIGQPPIRMHDDDWRVPACPPSGPAIRLSLDGTVRIAWYTGAPGLEGVWFRESLPEAMDSTSTPLALLTGLGLPTVHIGIGEAGMSGTLIACDADSTGANRLTLVRVEPSGRRVIERFVVPDTDGASYPRVAAEPVARAAYVAWVCRTGGHSQLRLARWNLRR